MRKIPDKKTVKEIEWLFAQAKEKASTQEETSKKFVSEARKKAKRANLSLKKYRRLFCHSCNSYFIPGENCTVRIGKGKKIIKCLKCSNYMRIKL